MSCAALNKSGNPCAQPFVGEDGFCAVHSPTSPQDMVELGRKSGEARQPKTILPADVPKAMESPEDITTWSSWLALKLAKGEIDPKTAREISVAITSFRTGHDYKEGQRKAREALRVVAEMKKANAARGRTRG